MPTYVALLRGVNVGGRKLPMAQLRDTFAALGHSDVRTYIQSGNVVFGATGTKTTIRSALERAVHRDFGLDVTVLLRTPSELTSILQRNPFGDDAYVTFLDDKPAAKQAAAIDAAPFAPDAFVVDGKEVFVHCPNGYGRTKINNSFFERKLATRATTRNWNTVKLLQDWSTD